MTKRKHLIKNIPSPITSTSLSTPHFHSRNPFSLFSVCVPQNMALEFSKDTSKRHFHSISSLQYAKRVVGRKKHHRNRMLEDFPAGEDDEEGADAWQDDRGSYADFHHRDSELRESGRASHQVSSADHDLDHRSRPSDSDRISFETLKEGLRRNRDKFDKEDENKREEPMKSRRKRLSKIDLKTLNPRTQRLIEEEHKMHSSPTIFKRPLSLPEHMADSYKIPFTSHEELSKNEEFLHGGSALIALDVGQSMIGMAYTPTQTRAAPLGAIKWKGKSIRKLAKAIKGELMIKTYPIAAVVVGIQEEYALQSSRLYKIIKECWERERIMVPLLFQDEYRTTQDAMQYLKTSDALNMTELNSGSRNASLEKRKIDMISAQFILQRALNKIHDLSMFSKITAQDVDDQIKESEQEKVLANHAVKMREEYDDKIMRKYAKLNVLLASVKEKRKELGRKKKPKESSAIHQL
uniref:YqgF/RNase H-like domain-containing protein n=1 Tax=Percolomonas cosmopolitus TaxID=63605 RepID=A0A7S1KTE7_9EUKA